MARVYLQLTSSAFEDSEGARIEIQLNDFKLPKAAANFLYLTSAHQIPSDVLQRREQFLAAPLPPPLKGTNILRISADRKQMDFGGSPSSSVFNGCYDDDCDLNSVRNMMLQQHEQSNNNNPKRNSASAAVSNPFSSSSSATKKIDAADLSMFQHNVGTISVSNCGPNTNGSRYFISLCRRPELDGLHQIVGCVAPQSLEILQLIAASHRVHSKAKGGNNITVGSPDPAIVISDCGIIRAHDAWKQLALGTEQQGGDDPAAGGKKPSRLLQRGQDRGKRLDTVSETFATTGGTNASTKEGELAAEMGEVARRNAKRRRIESAAAGAGAWQEPEEIASASATTGGAVSSEHHRAEWDASGALAREKKAQQQQQQQQNPLSRRQRWAQDAGDTKPQQPLSERNIFAIAARTSQFEQDLKDVQSHQKTKTKKKQGGGKKLRY